MAKIPRGRRRLQSRQFRSAPYPVPSYNWEAPQTVALEKKDWEDATCSVCMEFPHNAVLLLCSSHSKGCRPYMCGTSDRHSNCLDQFKKAYSRERTTPLFSPGWTVSEKPEAMDLACPLCRGQVKGWTVVAPAREYLDKKKRNCMQENCPFAGTYRELRKHVRSEHPCAKPREVDPALEQKWRTIERDSERQDVISTIRSSMPGSLVLGDYVIEVNRDEFESEGSEGINLDGGEFEGVGGRGISRSILYFFLREGARLMRLHRENGTASEDEDGGGRLPTVDGNDADAGADVGVGFSDGEYDDEDDDDDMVDPDRRRRRRRRSRGGGLIYDTS